MAGPETFNPAVLKPSMKTSGGDLKPSLVTSAYSSGTPGAGDLKPSLLKSDGDLKESLLSGGSLKPSLTSGTDADAAAYFAAVEGADGQSLEPAVKVAIESFVVGCKADGLWDAIKASCILAGARTLSGSLVALRGTGPTNNGPFIAGDYNRKTGLAGDGSTKYLNTGRAGNADPQNNSHLAVYVTTAPTTASSGSNSFGTYIGNVTGATTGARAYFREVSNGAISARGTSSIANTSVAAGFSTGFIGMQRSQSDSYVFRAGSVSSTIARASQTPNSNVLSVYRITSGIASETTYSNARLAFYSIGESLDLAKLDSRITSLINALGAAIP